MIAYIGIPMHLSQCTGLERHDRSCNGFRCWEVARVDGFDAASASCCGSAFELTCFEDIGAVAGETAEWRRYVIAEAKVGFEDVRVWTWDAVQQGWIDTWRIFNQ